MPRESNEQTSIFHRSGVFSKARLCHSCHLFPLSLSAFLVSFGCRFNQKKNTGAFVPKPSRRVATMWKLSKAILSRDFAGSPIFLDTASKVFRCGCSLLRVADCREHTNRVLPETKQILLLNNFATCTPHQPQSYPTAGHTRTPLEPVEQFSHMTASLFSRIPVDFSRFGTLKICEQALRGRADTPPNTACHSLFFGLSSRTFNDPR